MYTHILIPTDGSELAQKGVDHGLSLAKALGSKVTIITVTEPFPRGYGEGWAPSPEDIQRYNDGSKKAATELLSAAKAQADKLGVNAEMIHTQNDSPATAIVDCTKQKGCNLIVMSSHGRRGIARMFLGSQTSEVLAHSEVPVLVIR